MRSVSGHCPAERWRTRQIPCVWQKGAVVKLLLHWFWLGLDNYQTGVDRFCLVNWHHQRLTERWWCVKGFCCEVFFVCCGSCVVRTVSYYVGCWINIFSSANYIMLTSLDKYFLTTVFSSWVLDGSLSLAWQYVHAVREHDDFLKTYFTR